MVKIPGIIYAGNHGFEVDYKGINLKLFKDTHFEVLLHKIYIDLRKKMRGIKGVLLENKKMTISVHYRLVASGKLAELKTVFNKVLIPYRSQQKVIVTTGKKVLEIRPPLAWGKGELVSWLLEDVARDKNDIAVFYFGDDCTDEDVFKVLKGKGYTIVVGKNKKTRAEYFVKDPGEVRKVLEQLEQNMETKR
jgi:trehalose-phosphatase